MDIIRPISINDAALVSSNVPETDYAAYNAGTTYGLGARCIVVAAEVHQVWESVAAGNLGNTPASSPTKWVLVGATNRWRMFDKSINAQTSNPDSIQYEITAAGRIDTVSFFNVNAASIQVTMTDPAEGTVFDQTTSMVSDSGINNWYAYFIEPIVRASELNVAGLPPYANASISIILTDTGNTVSCGECVLGLSRAIGGIEWGASVRIQDYSVKTQDDFGNVTIVERAYSKLAGFVVEVDSNFVDQLQILLASLRATPVVYIGTSLYSATIVYGFFKDFTIAIEGVRSSVCTIDIEGLT